MKKRKFLVVSNRLPVSVTKKDGVLHFSPSSGGLATALARVHSEGDDRLWIGWPGIASDDLTPAEKSKIVRELNKLGCHPIFLTKNQIEKYYDGYSNDTIWPLFHYFQSYDQHDADYFDGYIEVNEIFKKSILKYADKNTSIWIHDYHLMLLPQLVRNVLPGSTIGFFLHIPFPSYEIFRLLPNRSEILEGLLGADLVGFHVYDYARHFLSSVLRILGTESSHGLINTGDRIVKVDAFPIGIDYEKFAKAHESPKIQKEIKSLEKQYKDQKIILSVDRLDYSKGIAKRLEAYERLIRDNPSNRKNTVLIVVAVPSRTEVETYRKLKNKLEETINRINKKYGTSDWTPISYKFKNLNFDQVAAHFWVADIALLTPLRDGMNLVAKEYVATKQNKPGVLILSEMTGAVDELPEAIRINPNDIDAIVKSIKLGLKMPKSKQAEKINLMQERLSKYTVNRWAEDFIEHMDQSKLGQKQRGKKFLDSESEAKILRSFNGAKNRLIVLDYDGTLRDFVSINGPKYAVPQKSLKNLIEKLSKLPNSRLCIVSGRQKNALESWFGHLDISMAAEHGAWIKTDGEWSRHEISLKVYRERIMNILERYLERTPGAYVEEKDFSIVWHYRDVLTELAHARNAALTYELNQLLNNTDFGVFKGAKIIEVKVKKIHKGVVVEDLYAMYSPDFTLCIGDDFTDEDMFTSAPDEAYTIKVGLEDTNARYQLVGVNDVLKLLKKIAG